MSKMLNLKLKIWRQDGPHAQGAFLDVDATDIPEDASFLEMLDVVNERLIADDIEPIAFGHDCREGICGTCGVMINGQAHGPEKATATCQLHMRKFADGDEIVVEPWKAAAFPVLKDLMVDRRAFDRIIEAGGYISVPTGTPQDANATLIPKEVADTAMDAAACIGCGACVAACKNASAMLFVSAKVSQLAILPQGNPERNARVLNMVAQMDKEGFGSCTNTSECEAACPAEVSVAHIARLNREYLRASIFAET